MSRHEEDQEEEKDGQAVAQEHELEAEEDIEPVEV